MPRDSNGTYSLPAGNPVVSGELITAAWANATMNDLADAITGSLSRTGLGGMEAGLLFGDGVVAAPGIAWEQEPGTGFYRAGTGDMRVVTAGDGDVMRWYDGQAFIRDATDTTWEPILYEGGAGTVPDGTTEGDTLVWDATPGEWARQAANPGGVLPVGTVLNDTLRWNGTAWVRQAANPGGVLPVGTVTNTLLQWNDTTDIWEAVEWADISHVEDGSADGQTLYWDDVTGIWASTGVLTIDPVDGVVTVGSGMTADADYALSVLNTLWVGNGAGTAGITLLNVSDTAMSITAGARSAPGTGAKSITVAGTSVTINAATGDVIISNAGTPAMTLRSDGYIVMHDMPVGAAPDTPPIGAPTGSLYRNTSNNELSITP